MAPLDSQEILVCSAKSQGQDEAYYASIEDYLSSLNDAVLYEQKLAYALFGEFQTLKNEGERFQLLMEFDQSFPKTPLILMDALNICATSPRQACTDEFVNYALSADYENGAMWLNAAMIYASKGNDSAVLEMIAGIEKANVFNERRGERITVFVNALSAAPEPDFASNLMAGFGAEAARTIGYAPITNWCKQGANEAQIASACLSLGRSLDIRGTTSLSRLIGIAIQQLIYEGEQNSEAIEQLEQRAASLRQVHQSGDAAKAFELFQNDGKRLRQWLANIDNIGENAATQALIDEAIEVSRFVGKAYCEE